MAIAILLISYGGLLGLGGVMAFIRAKTRVSLIVGGFAGAVLIISGALTAIGVTAGSYLGLAMTLLLCLLFALRYRRTRKIRPVGLLLVVSVVVAVVLVYMLIM